MPTCPFCHRLFHAMEWEDWELDYLLKNRDKSISHLTYALCRAADDVINQLRKSGVKVSTMRFRPDELEFIKANYTRMTDSEIGIHLGRTQRSIKEFRWAHGLHKYGSHRTQKK